MRIFFQMFFFHFVFPNALLFFWNELINLFLFLVHLFLFYFYFLLFYFFNNIIVWMVLYCEHQLLGVKKNKTLSPPFFG